MVIHVILLRHALADADFQGPDQDRPLTQRGIYQFKHYIENFLKKLPISWEKMFILSSPFLRTCQTADLLANAAGTNFEVVEALGDKFDEIEVFKRLDKAKAGETYFLIGHEPSLLTLSRHFVSKEHKSNLPSGIGRGTALVFKFEDRITKGKGELYK